MEDADLTEKGFFGAAVRLGAIGKKNATFSFFSRVENMDFMFLCVFIVIIALNKISDKM